MRFLQILGLTALILALSSPVAADNLSPDSIMSTIEGMLEKGNLDSTL